MRRRDGEHDDLSDHKVEATDGLKSQLMISPFALEVGVARRREHL